MNDRQDDPRRNRGGDNSADETRFIGRQPESGQDGPRQYFPGRDGAGHQDAYQDHDFAGGPYGQPGPGQPPDDRQQFTPRPGGAYEFEEEPRRRGRAGAWILGVLLVLALIAVIVLFFLWQNAAMEADREPPPPVTETSTVEQTTTVPPSPAEDPTGEPENPLPTNLPDINPENLPEELNPENLPDINPEDINPEELLPEGYNLDDLRQFLN